MIKDKYHSQPNLRFPVCYVKQPLITLCCCFWRNQGGARSLSPQFHAFYTLLSTSKTSVQAAQAAVVFGFPVCKSRVEFPSSVGQRNVSEEFQKLFSGQAVEYVLVEQRGTRCRVDLSLFCGVWEFARHILQHKISHVVMTAMCMSEKRFHKPNQQIAATWLTNTFFFSILSSTILKMKVSKGGFCYNASNALKVKGLHWH